MVRVLIFAFLAHLALLIAAVADCLGGDEAPRRFPKAVWVLIIVFLPILGGILWFTFGRARPDGGGSAAKRHPNGGRGGGPRRPRGPVAPDDDPDFLRDLDRQLRRNEADEERDDSSSNEKDESDKDQRDS
ncbi:PLD nuclease N-terminal domain-containing protein [Natronoglycomyces albus]|uniref:PLDc_N domain-containing protein n=1 Tax=Natronoglycomyces albus TaxID=2811108 RepID=A0A895XTA4_9ACTN|nr:PLD nuclease N-terminal domain-containing protein [Natronoglycomyces albus]QSB06539.1 PLDc_N domain-containing protein [Natronoglycomyces albus]